MNQPDRALRGAAQPTALTELDVVSAWLSDLWLLAHRRDLPPDVQQQIERDVHHIRELLSRGAPPAGPSPEPSEEARDAPTDEELDGWPLRAREVWSDMHRWLDKVPDDTPNLDAAHDAIPLICRVLARGAFHPEEAK